MSPACPFFVKAIKAIFYVELQNVSQPLLHVCRLEVCLCWKFPEDANVFASAWKREVLWLVMSLLSFPHCGSQNCQCTQRNEKLCIYPNPEVISYSFLERHPISAYRDYMASVPWKFHTSLKRLLCPDGSLRKRSSVTSLQITLGWHALQWRSKECKWWGITFEGNISYAVVPVLLSGMHVKTNM